jgi:dipeptidyl aminopeptidase/acylaminoacyl peptidase
MPFSTMLWSQFGIALMLLPLICGMPAFADPKPWTLDAIMDLKTVSDPQITADGSRVVYVVTGRDAHRNAYSSEIRVVPVTGGDGQRLANGHFSDAHPRWSGDGGSLAFVSRRDGTTQIYLVNTPGASPRRVSNSTEGVIDFRWSPDGRYIGYLAADPNPEQAAKRKTGDDAIVGGEGYTPTRLRIIRSRAAASACSRPAEDICFRLTGRRMARKWFTPHRNRRRGAMLST